MTGTTVRGSAIPRDFTVLLPPGWTRIPIDGRESARAVALAAQKTADLTDPQRSQVREKLARLIRSALRDARSCGGIDIMISLAERDGVPLAASCLISYVDQGQRVPMDMLAAQLSGEGGDVAVVQVGGDQAVRRRYREIGMTKLDYFLPLPGRMGLLITSFGTPVEPLADAFLLLFDAIAQSLRWQS
jgi:hypothetical protein